MGDPSLRQLQSMIVHNHTGATLLLLVTGTAANSRSQLGIQVKHIEFL